MAEQDRSTWWPTEEEITEALKAPGYIVAAYYHGNEEKIVGKLYARKLVKWGFELCDREDHWEYHVILDATTRFDCEGCMQQLRREVGLE